MRPRDVVASPMKPSRSLFVPVRGLSYHVRTWGDPAARKLFLLHGWMDVSASFQFLVDALADDWYVLAPDWRGFGLSETPQDGYWFLDYVADLDALARALAPGEAIDVAGHSLGANVALVHAGARPAGVAHVIALDGFGVPEQAPEQAPDKLRKWLDALAEPADFATYRDLAAVADRLQKNNRRLSRARAEFLAQHWAEVQPDGTARLRADPKHKLPFPDHVPDGRHVRGVARDPGARALGGGRGVAHRDVARRPAAMRRPKWRGASRTCPTGGWSRFPAPATWCTTTSRSWSRRSSKRSCAREPAAARGLSRAFAARRVRRARGAHADLGQQLDRDEVRAPARASR